LRGEYDGSTHSSPNGQQEKNEEIGKHFFRREGQLIFSQKGERGGKG
jgi:hypothetical protein